jgi:C1A family cysteine protease
MSFFILFLLSFGLHARTLEPVMREDTGLAAKPEYQAIMAKVKSFGPFTPESQPEKVEEKPKELSRGQMAVEEAKARNREIIARQRGEEKKVAEADMTKDTFSSDLAKMKAEDKRIRDGWKKEVRDQLKIWQTQQKIFLGKINVYKDATFPIPVKTEKIIEKPVPARNIPEVHIVHSGMSIPVRDQEGRATCAAFTGIRAMEILLAQNNEPKDLSEEYFYWASKPECQANACSKKGSWVTRGYDYSQNRPAVDVPSEKTCPYETKLETGNETHVPLRPACKDGVVKVAGYEEIKTLSEVNDRLKKNMPVNMSSKLTPNFFINDGLVTIEGSEKNGNVDSHAMGHAYLAIGVVELPEKLHDKEGKYCLVVNNSWGTGWGAGGYSCLTENWLLKYRLPAAFVALKSVTI